MRVSVSQSGGLATWLKVAQLKKARARSYCVNVHPHAICLRGYVCEELYARCVTGAKRDRDAFDGCICVHRP